MAFVRYKMVKGKKYYQYVRNYREDRRHKQEVLCHLGHHDSLDGAIDGENRKMLDCRKIASRAEREANGTKAYLLEFYGDELGNRMPTYWEAESRWETFLEEREESLFERRSNGYLYPLYLSRGSAEKESEQWEKRLRSEEDLVDSILEYHHAQWDARRFRAYEKEARDKLDKLIEVRHKHPQG